MSRRSRDAATMPPSGVVTMTGALELRTCCQYRLSPLRSAARRTLACDIVDRCRETSHRTCCDRRVQRRHRTQVVTLDATTSNAADAAASGSKARSVVGAMDPPTRCGAPQPARAASALPALQEQPARRDSLEESPRREPAEA